MCGWSASTGGMGCSPRDWRTVVTDGREAARGHRRSGPAPRISGSPRPESRSTTGAGSSVDERDAPPRLGWCRRRPDRPAGPGLGRDGAGPGSPCATPSASSTRRRPTVSAHDASSIPEVAWAGLTERPRGRRSRGRDGPVVLGFECEGAHVGLHRGLVKLVFPRAGQGLLGVHIVGEVASRARPHRAARHARRRHDRPGLSTPPSRCHAKRSLQVRRVRWAHAPRTERAGGGQGRLNRRHDASMPRSPATSTLHLADRPSAGASRERSVDEPQPDDRQRSQAIRVRMPKRAHDEGAVQRDDSKPNQRVRICHRK